MNGFYYDNFPWYVRAENESQCLYASRKIADWTCSEIDYEFSFDKDKKIWKSDISLKKRLNTLS